MASTYFGTIFGTFVNSDANPSNTFATVSSMPFTMACCFNPDGLQTTALACINRSIAQGFTDFEHWTFELGIDGTVIAQQDGPGFTHAGASIGTYNVGSWNFAIAEFVSNSERSIYLSNASATNTSFANTPTVGDTQIGARVLGPTYADIFRGFEGCQEQFCLWDTLLSTSDKNAFLNGTAYPNTIEPAHVKLYIPQLTGATVANAYAWDGSGVNPITDYASHGSIATCASAPIITPGGTSWKPDIRHY